MLPDRQLYKIRAHVLVTPVGLQLLSTPGIVSGCTVPEQLPVGIVRDPRPYLVDFSVGSSRYEVVPPQGEEAVNRAAIAVGRGFAWAVAYGFQTS